MKRQLLFLLFLVPALLAFESEETTLTGYIRALDQDDDGKTTSVFLENDDDIYYIKNSGKGAELIRFVDEKMTLTGHFEEDEDGNQIFVVTAYANA